MLPNTAVLLANDKGPRRVVYWECGFLVRAPGHTASWTDITGTYCSTCHEPVYNPYFHGSLLSEDEKQVGRLLNNVNGEPSIITSED